MNKGTLSTVEQVELTKKRCREVIDRIEDLQVSTNFTESCKRTLLKLAHSELNFLSRPNLSCPLSVNIGHLEAVVYILRQHSITGVSRVCKPIPLPCTTRNVQGNHSSLKSVHVDIICSLNGNPVWIIVSDRNPKYVSWQGCHRDKGLKARIEEVLAAARSSRALKPSSIILFFSNGLDRFSEKLQEEFGASEYGFHNSASDVYFSEELEDGWINVLCRSYKEACVLEIKIDAISSLGYGVKDPLPSVARSAIACTKVDLGDSFCSLISGLISCPLDVKDVEYAQAEASFGDNIINFDTTALVAIVSGISNGGSKKLLAGPENDVRQRFKGNYKFVIGQAMSEIENPLHAELSGIISGKRGMISETVHSEFKELVFMCGGPKEKLRAEQLLNCLMIVPDCSSERMTSLPTTRNLPLKNKVVFGTGDYWHAPTLTANMAFIRAVCQTGMSLFSIEHRPRALTGD